MKIVVVTGSPHKSGTTALLADKFIEGAQSAGHEVFRFDAAFEDIHPCLGCDRCGMDGDCIQNDAILQTLMPQLLQADLIALVTPVYFFAMTAQIKTIVDRFYSRTDAIRAPLPAVCEYHCRSASRCRFGIHSDYPSLPSVLSGKR